MRRRLLSLILAQLNMNFAISYSRYYYFKKRERMWEPVLIAVGIGMLAVMLGTGVFKLTSAFYDATAMVGQGAVTVVLGMLLAQVVVLVLGFVLVISVFYFSNDLDLLIPLPLVPAEVLLGKFSVILASEYIGLFVFLIPFFVAYGIKAGVNPIAYTISALLVFLALPVIPLVIAAIPAIFLMRVTNLSRRKDTLLMIGGFLFIALMVGFQVFVQTRVPEMAEGSEFIRKVFSTANALVDVVGRRFPPSLWATKALVDSGTLSGLLYLMLFLGISALGLVTLIGIGNKVFYEGVVSGFEAASPRKARPASGELPVSTYLQRSPLVALALAEVRLFTRTPVFVLNGFTGFVMFPVMFIAVTVAGRAGLAPLMKQLSALPEMEAVGALAVGAYFLVLAAMSSIPVTPFSREGLRNIWIPMSLPLNGRTVALGKALGAEMMIVPGALPGVAVLEYLLRIPPVYLVAGIVIGVAASFIFCQLGVIIDMARPMLNWNDQQKAIKSNLNTLFGMLAGIFITVALGFIAKLAFDAGLAGWTVVAGMVLIVGAMLVLTLRIAGAIADRIWTRGLI